LENVEVKILHFQTAVKRYISEVKSYLKGECTQRHFKHSRRKHRFPQQPNCTY